MSEQMASYSTEVPPTSGALRQCAAVKSTDAFERLGSDHRRGGTPLSGIVHRIAPSPERPVAATVNTAARKA